MDQIKKIWKFLISMKFAVILLVVLVIACTAGSIKDGVFGSWWFILITAFLVLNLVFCNLIRLPDLVRRTRKMAGPLRNRIGIWGAWVCHLGILIIIIGFGFGQRMKEQYVVYGVPGQTKPVGETGLALTINDFVIDKYEDGSVKQYTSDITVFGMDGSEIVNERGLLSVNDPARIRGMRFYQNSTGWAAHIRILEDGEPLQEGILCAGEYVPVQDKEELIIYLNAIYPDYVFIDGKGPATAGEEPVDPGYLYTVYYKGEILGMNVLMQDEELTIDEYTVTFDEPQHYTLIEIKRDPLMWLAFIGGMITTLGLVLAFYVKPVKEKVQGTLAE